MPEPYSKEGLSIKRLRDLAYRLNFPIMLLEKTAEEPENFYRFRYKKKPNGKLREYCSVGRPLKDIQKAIQRLLRELYLPKNVHGGIKDNLAHLCGFWGKNRGKRLFYGQR